MDAVCQRRQSLVVFKRDVQLCIIGLFPVWAAMYAISGCRSLLQSFEDTFLELVTVENPNITVGILTLSITVPEIEVFPVWAAILLFPVVGHFHNHLGALCLNSPWLKPQNCCWNFDAIYHSSRDINISALGDHIAISGCRSLLQSSEGTFFELAMVEKPIIVVGISMLSIIVPEI